MQEEISKIFAGRLSAAISDRGLPKKTIAEMAGVHPVTISKYLAGKRIPASEELHNLASVLRVNTSWLLGSSDDKIPVNLAAVLAREEGDKTGESTLREEAASYRAGPDYLAEIVKLSHTADLSSLLDTMENLSKSAGVTSPAAAAVAQMVPIVRDRLNQTQTP